MIVRLKYPSSASSAGETTRPSTKPERIVNTARTPIAQIVASNSPQHVEVKVYSYQLLAGRRDRPVDVELRSKEGRVFVKHLTRAPYPDRTTLPVFEYRKLPGNLAYVAINTFNSEDVQKEFEKYLPEIRGSDGLILDVRQNDGGSGVIAYDPHRLSDGQGFRDASMRSPSREAARPGSRRQRISAPAWWEEVSNLIS